MKETVLLFSIIMIRLLMGDWIGNISANDEIRKEVLAYVSACFSLYGSHHLHGGAYSPFDKGECGHCSESAIQPTYSYLPRNLGGYLNPWVFLIP